mgnify:CR=1 FL=1
MRACPTQRNAHSDAALNGAARQSVRRNGRNGMKIVSRMGIGLGLLLLAAAPLRAEDDKRHMLG